MMSVDGPQLAMPPRPHHPMGRGTQPTWEHCQLQAAQRTHRRTHRAMRFFFWHTHVGNLRGSVVFFRSRNDYLCERFSLSPGPQQWSTFRKPACRTGGDAGAAPAGSTIGLMRKQRPENRGAAVCVDCESNKEKVSQRLPHLTCPSVHKPVGYWNADECFASGSAYEVTAS